MAWTPNERKSAPRVEEKKSGMNRDSECELEEGERRDG